MSTKILIIGQAPPAVKQQVPYDTTMFYDMLLWVGCNKKDAQLIFDFEAMTDKFPGHGLSGHKIPSVSEMKEYYERVLKQKIENSTSILVFGNVARDFLQSVGAFEASAPPYRRIVFMLHPSKRNYDRIMKNKSKIIEDLKWILKTE